MKITEKQLRVLKANNEEAHLETRERIKSGMLSLLQKKQYYDISMTDVIHESGVSRSGVYKNYRSKDDIMFDIYSMPVNDIISALGSSIFENIDAIFRTGKKHEKEFRIIIDAGLEHNILAIINRRYEDPSLSFYYSLWIGMIFNAFFEWMRAKMPEPVEAAIERVREDLKLVAETIEADMAGIRQERKP